MISNIQHQQFDSVAIEKILPSSPTVVVDKYANNNNSNMNKNIHIMTSNDLLTTSDQDPDVIIFDPSVDYFDINSSSDTKETITIAASQSLYENAPLIRAIPITTATNNSTATTNLMKNSKHVLDFNNSNQNHSSPSKIEFGKLKIDPDDMRKIIPNHEYALKRPVENIKQNNILKNQSQQNLSINKTYNNQHEARQQSRTEALRFMDIHNYSKINRFDDSTNSSSPEDDDDDEDDDEDVDDDYDDDVFGTTTTNPTTAIKRSTTSLSSTKNHYTKKNCDSSANKLNPQRKQSQSQINQNNHKIERLGSFEFDRCLPSKMSSSANISPMKIDTGSCSSSSTTSPKSNTNSPVDGSVGSLMACTGVPDDIENGGMSGDKSAPDHHARRPMNAFLIFCKRHRAIVRDKYKNLENRQITKILGEWWATLSNIEKACYTDLAKQYKDAFFKANPNFKWYKLPAPPLRTCTIRPGPHSPTSPLPGNNYNFPNDHHYNITSSMNGINDDDNEIDRFNCDNGFVRKSSTSSITNSSDINLSENSNNNRHNSNNSSNNGNNSSNGSLMRMMNGVMGSFKLADEAQMGGLSSLMCGNSNNGSCSSNSSSSASSPVENCNGGIGLSDNATNGGPACGRNNIINDNKHENRIDALQNALSETSYFLSNTMPSHKNDIEPFQHMRNHAFHMESNQMLNGKRKVLDSSSDWSVKKKLFISTDGNDYDMEPKKASRSCKGKRYKELMISGQIISTTKKGVQKLRSPTSNPTLNGYYKSFENLATETNNLHASSEQYLPRINRNEKIETTIPDQIDNNCQDGGVQTQLDSPNSQKQFDASDFDLEEKIKALPAQCLDSYLSRKRETKKKKKIGSKRRATSSSSSSLAQKSQLQPSQQLLQPRSNQLGQSKSPPKTIYEARERIQSAMVGSQKRKARKESITRRDVNTISSSSVDLLSPATNTLLEAVSLVNRMNENGGVEIKVEYDIETYNNDEHMIAEIMTDIKQEDYESNPCTNNLNGTPTSDLLILAEVATNHIVDEVNN